MKVYLATDHAGFEMKNALAPFLRDLGYEVEDCGDLFKNENDDYPEFISIAAKKLSADAAAGIESRAIVLGGSGQGEAMEANRFAHVRAAVYYGQPREMPQGGSGRALDILTLSREHNNANALALGARFISIDEAKEAAKIWLSTAFSGEARHVRRIEEIEKMSHD